MVSCRLLKRGQVVAIFIVCLCLILFICSQGINLIDETPRIILDTDISSDVDDAGAVAVLHALADRGDVEILGMVVSSGDPWGAACLEALNTQFGRPDILVGEIKKPRVSHVSKYTRYIAENYPPDIHFGDDVPDATRLYRKILAGQEDDSITIVSIGYLSNLYDLLQSGPDEFSSLSGQELVAKKIKKLVCMGGVYPSGREWNFYQDTEATSYVLSVWPTDILFSGFEIGNKVMTGRKMRKFETDHPLVKAYQLYNNIENRQSWDQIAVLLAGKYGIKQKQWELSVPGIVKVGDTGSNNWTASKNGKHRYMIETQKTKELAHVIDSLMVSSLQNKSYENRD